MPALFEITQDILEAYETLVDSDGEVSTENEAALVTLSVIEAEKLDSFFYVIRKAEMEEAAAKAMYEQWRKKADARRKAIDWLKNAVQTHLTATGQTKATTPSGNTFAVQKNGGRPGIKIQDGISPTDVDPKYTVVKVEFNNDAIREAMDRDEPDASFAYFAPVGSHLRLR